MPPPTASDPWLTSRRFGLVVDAGSSGSRLQIYSWKDARSVRQTLDLEALDRLPQVEKGVPSGDDWLHKVEPGISSFAQNPMGIPEYLAPLLEHAKDTVPPSLHRETPIFLLATAGMRLLPKDQQNSIIEATCIFFRANSNFRLEAPSIIGPCGSSVRIISGEEEGIFGWISVNYLMDGFTGHDQHHRGTYGFLDMGGASTQIAFEPGPSERESMSHTTADTLVDVRLRLLSGEEIKHPVFVTTWLGYGTNQARERYIGSQVKNWLSSGHGSTNSIPDPCLPKQLKIPLSPQAISGTDAKAGESHELIGTGSFEQCLVQTAPLLNNDRPCPDMSCLFNGVPAPRIDFSLSKFIGVSEYWYSSEHVFGLGGAYDVVQYERAAIEFCSREWSDIVQEHKETHFDEFGKPIPPSTWGKEVGLNRLQLQCFKAAWVVNVLHQGIRLPRIVDSGGNQTTGEAGTADEKAKAKGLGPNLVGPATFQSVDTIGDTAVSWTLGKMVLEASKEVPPISLKTPPLLDPNPNRHPSWSESHGGIGRSSTIHFHLMSPTLYPVYVVLMIMCIFLVHILRRRILPNLVLPLRSRRRHSGPTYEYLNMEEGGGSNLSSSSSPPSSPTSTAFVPKSPGILKSVRRIFRFLTKPIRRQLGYSRTLYRNKPIRSSAGKNLMTQPTLSQARSIPTGFAAMTSNRMHHPPNPRSFSYDTAVAPPPRPKRQLSGSILPSLISRGPSTTPPSMSQRSSFSGSRPPSIRIASSRPPSEQGNDSDSDPSGQELEFDYTYDDDYRTNMNLATRPGPPVSPSGRLAALGVLHSLGSRNSSQVNLTSAVPRAMNVSRLEYYDH